MDDMRKGLIELQEDGCMSEGRLEASIVSINDLIRQLENPADTRMSKMSAIMKERDRQADKLLKLMTSRNVGILMRTLAWWS